MLRLLILAVLGALLVAWGIEEFAHHQAGPWPEALQVSAALVLISVTALYVTRTSENVALQREQMDRAERPIVVPAPSGDWFDGEARSAEVAEHPQVPDSRNNLPSAPLDWANAFTVKNLGPGVALNVRAHLENLGSPSGVCIESVMTNLGPGDREDLRLNWASPETRVEVWEGAKGWIDFEDIAGGRWRGTFYFQREGKRLLLLTRAPLLQMRPDGTPTG